MNRAWRRIGVTLLAVAVFGMVGAAQEAAAHPLGSVTVNHYHGMTLRPDGVRDLAVVDTAEIPTRQRRPLIDTDGDGTVGDGEAAAYAARLFG